MLSRIAEREEQTLGRAVLGDQPDPGLQRVGGLAQANLLAATSRRPTTAGAEEREEERKLSLALETADADDLPAADLHAHVAEPGRGREVHDLAHDVARSRLSPPRGIHALDLAPEHQLDEPVLGHLADRPAADVDAAAKDGDPVAEVLDLLEAV